MVLRFWKFATTSTHQKQKKVAFVIIESKSLVQYGRTMRDGKTTRLGESYGICGIGATVKVETVCKSRLDGEGEQTRRVVVWRVDFVEPVEYPADEE